MDRKQNNVEEIIGCLMPKPKDRHLKRSLFWRDLQLSAEGLFEDSLTIEREHQQTPGAGP